MPVKELCGPSKAQDLQIEVSTRAEGWALAGERGGLWSEGRGEAGRGGGGDVRKQCPSRWPEVTLLW